jgi:C4-dicarboxylate transporter, DctM subunit
MIDLTAAVVGFTLLVGLMSLGLHVAFVMFAISMAGAIFYLGTPAVMEYGTQYWGATNNFVLVAVPLFVLLGELLVRGGFTDRMYRSLSDWLNPLPGGLLHTNIGASAMFAAVSGSSVATAATIGTVALPPLRARGYPMRDALGSLAAGGTLGILIPPSVNMIVYGSLTNNSIGKLFIAGIIPGLLLTSLFMLLIFVRAMTTDGLKGVREEERLPLGERLRLLVNLVPPLIVFGVVMGSLYFGIATATESAALGVIVALGFVWHSGRLTRELLQTCFHQTARISGMILLIIAAAFILNLTISLTGIADQMTRWVTSFGMSATAMLFALILFYLVLGMFMDVLSMQVATIPLTYPIVTALGVDPIWFGVFIVLMCELGLITPPVGMNLFVVHGIRPDKGGIEDAIWGALPYAVIMILFTILLILWPQLVLYLPNKM